MARKYRVRMGEFDIGHWEYQEVESLCRRYRAMKRRADVLERCNAPGVHGEEYAAMRWECAIVEQALRETGGGTWQEALKQSCCDGVAYVDIDPVIMPTSCRNDFFIIRREFFWRLWQLRQKQIGKAAKQGANESGGENHEKIP